MLPTVCDAHIHWKIRVRYIIIFIALKVIFTTNQIVKILRLTSPNAFPS